MKRVIFTTNYGLHSEGGGVKIYTRNLVEASERLDVKVELLIREGAPTDSEIKLPSNKFLYVISAMRELLKQKPKHVVSQGGWFTALPVLFYKAKARNVRAVYIYHTHYDPPITFTQKLMRHLERLLMTFILSRFDVVLFVSRELKRNMEDAGALRVTTRWSVLYGAPRVKLPRSNEVEEFRKKFKLANNKDYLLGLGLTALPSKVKGAKLLIDALAQMPSRVILILTRSGRFAEYLKAYAVKQKINGRVIFTGDLENPHVATLASEIYTHVTFGEGGLSLSLLEVMHIGKPILASKVGGIPEAIRHPLEGILVDNNVKDVAEAIRALVENPKLRKKMSVISRRAVNSRFSWEKTAKILIRILRIQDNET